MKAGRLSLPSFKKKYQDAQLQNTNKRGITT